MDWKNKVIRVGQPIAYDPSVKYEQQMLKTTEAIEDYFRAQNAGALR